MQKILAKNDGKNNGFIENGRQFVEGDLYDYEKLLELEKADEPPKSNSSPSSTSIQMNPQNSSQGIVS